MCDISNSSMKQGLHNYNYLKKAVIYEVNLRQYTHNGDISSFRKHLPRLKKMGVDILWFMPLFPIGFKNRKGLLGSYYSIKNFTEVNPEFGTNDDFKKLVNEIHRMGMKVMIDWVANHASWDNEWTTSHPDYFARNDQGDFFSPYDWTDVIQINHSNPDAHEALKRAMCYWVKEFNIDGFRADLAHLTPLDFWIQARNETSKIKEHLIWLAETEDHDYYNAFDIIYSWKWMHATEDFFNNKRHISLLKEILLSHKTKTNNSSLQLFFTSNHDENSWNGTEFEKYGHYVKALSAFSFLYPFSVPLIYSGQEIPNTKRLLFFDKDEIVWPEKPAFEMFFRNLIKLRKIFHDYELFDFFDGEEQLLGFTKIKNNKSVLILMNVSDRFICQNFKGQLNDTDFEIMMSYESLISEDLQRIELNSGGFIIIHQSRRF